MIDQRTLGVSHNFRNDELGQDNHSTFYPYFLGILSIQSWSGVQSSTSCSIQYSLSLLKLARECNCFNIFDITLCYLCTFACLLPRCCSLNHIQCRSSRNPFNLSKNCQRFIRKWMIKMKKNILDLEKERDQS